jgi:probable HAF family extracellular repeat protein
MRPCASRTLLPILLLVPSAAAQQAVRVTPGNLRPDEYVVDFVSTAAFGVDMNRGGDVVGTSYPDPGCGSFCLPPLETVAWRDGERIVLPTIPGLSGITVRDIDRRGRIVGFAGFPGTTTHAVLWQPVGSSYQALDLGTLPGTTIAEAVGIDELGRVVGWSTTASFPPSGSPFLWSEETGMIDLSLQGFPDEKPVAISPGGTVATAGKWYRLGSPSSVTPLAPPPIGFGVSSSPAAINDAGDQARFLVRLSGQNLVYLYRYHHEGAWQLLSPSPTGNLSRYGVGSIDDERTITGTVTSTGVIAHGPDGLAVPLIGLLSRAWVYPNRASTAVISAGPRNEKGEILAQVLLGRSPRLVRLAPASICWGSCLEIGDLAMDAVFVQDPSAPGSCAPSLSAHDEALVTLTVRSSSGVPLSGVQVTGRFLDDYWTNEVVTATSGEGGSASFSYTGPCGVGALEFLVEDARGGGFRLDRSAGTLSVWEIPALP